MTDQELKRRPRFVAPELDQREATDRGAMQGRQVGVVGLVARVGGLAELFGGEGVDNAGLEAGGGEGVLDRAVVATGAFDGDQEVFQVVVVDRLAESIDGGVEGRPVVCEGRRSHEHVAIEIGEHPLGPGLGAIDRDDAEVLGPNFLDARVKRAARLLKNVRASRAGALARVRTGHQNCLRTGVRAAPILSAAVWMSVLLLRKPTYQGSGVNGTSLSRKVNGTLGFSPGRGVGAGVGTPWGDVSWPVVRCDRGGRQRGGRRSRPRWSATGPPACSRRRTPPRPRTPPASAPPL